MAQFIKRFEQDLQKDVPVRQCGTVVFNGDDLSNVVELYLFDNGEPVDISDATLVCTVICPDGATVYINNGTITGNTVRMTLTAACFSVLGQIGVCIQLVNGTVKTTVLKAIFHTEKSITDIAADPNGRITLSVTDLISKIDAAKAELPANIVSNHAELLELDTDGLPDGYIVKVLFDETHDDERSYYRWGTTSDSWAYIGSDEGAYSKSETDALLAGKQNILAAFLKSAAVSQDGSTLTIEDKDGNEVEFSPSGGSGAVVSVNGQTGAVILDADDLGAAHASDLSAHTSNSSIHVASTDKSAWNSKYNKPSSGIPKSDLSGAVQASLDRADSAIQTHQDISGKANASDLIAHTGNTEIHVSSSDKSAWDSKYSKPSSGIPKTDLASSVQTSLNRADTALQTHQDISGKADVSALTSHTGNASNPHNVTAAQVGADVSGQVTIGGTTYTLRIGSEGAAGYITFVL